MCGQLGTASKQGSPVRHPLVRVCRSLLVCALTFVFTANTTQATDSRVLAPKFDGASAWLNVSRPIPIEELRGRIVLLDFWTYACINCMHVIPDLKKLESKFGDKLVVIGVHSAKFSNEKESENIRQAIIRNEINHPVINDANFLIWKAYAASSWPTFVLIDPQGYVVEHASGEGNYDFLSERISKLLDQNKSNIKITPLPIALERDKVPPTFLSFPGKILVDEPSKRIFIADSNHNRIVVAGFDGLVSEIIGGGSLGRIDGTFETASFYHPQGMALKGETLYVADTENHLIRAVDLKSKNVSTVAGTGIQGHDLVGGKTASAQELNSPWDLAIIGNNLYIAMAGSHQLWQMDLGTRAVSVFAGTGSEEITDGPLRAAALAQPSGLAADDKQLYFADSEVSALRIATLGDTGAVKTLIGHGLFKFGDKDGKLSEALLQHPLGVAVGGSKVYLADSFNHKIKEVDPGANSIMTIASVGTTFNEPGGLSFASGKLYVADTNNHAIKVIDIMSGNAHELKVINNRPSNAGAIQERASRSPSFLPNLSQVNLPEVHAGRGGELNLQLVLDLAEGLHLNEKAPSKATAGIITDTNGREQIVRINESSTTIPIKLPEHGDFASAQVDTTLYYCRTDGRGLCFIKSYSFTQPVKLVDGTKEASVELRAKLETP